MNFERKKVEDLEVVERRDREEKERIGEGTRKRGAKKEAGSWQGKDAWRVTPPAGGRRPPRRGKRGGVGQRKESKKNFPTGGWPATPA